MRKIDLFAALVVSGAMTVSADLSVDVGRWRVSFADEGARLSLAHIEGAAKVEGSLRFEGPAAVTGAGVGKDSAVCAWRVVSPRDGVPNRLALVDARDNVNGYISFQSEGEGLSLLLYHRTAFAYEGTLILDAAVRYRDDAYACSLTPMKGDRVLSVKSGPSVSLNDDALYSPSTDEALQIVAGKIVACAKRPSTDYQLSVELQIADGTANVLSFKVVKGWYKNRWVPAEPTRRQ